MVIIMNYEQKYREALERAKNLHKDAIEMGENIRVKQCEIIFPELKESEDERIRKEIIEFIKKRDRSGCDYDYDKWIAWLEKQGEQDNWAEELNNKIKELHRQCLEKIQEYVTPCWEKMSEEDEQYLLVCKNALAKYQTTDKWDASIISCWLEDKLKSLRPQSKWKPNEKQMHAFEQVYEWYNNNFAPSETLTSLYNDLKKLEGEKVMTQEELTLSIKSEFGRITGRTTRIIDDFVQMLYRNEGKWVVIFDHSPSDNNNRMVLEKVITRMEIEHPQDKLEIDRRRNRLKLVWCQTL